MQISITKTLNIILLENSLWACKHIECFETISDALVSYPLIVDNVSLNAAKVRGLDMQNLGSYSAGPCEWMQCLAGTDCVILP